MFTWREANALDKKLTDPDVWDHEIIEDEGEGDDEDDE